MLLTGPCNGPYPRVSAKARNEKTAMVPFMPSADTSIDAPEPFLTLKFAPVSLDTVGSSAPLCSMTAQTLDEPKRKKVCHSDPLMCSVCPGPSGDMRI